MTIILYDLSSALPQKAFTPNTWKTRLCLNYKGLPYKTEWIEFPDIKTDVYDKLGVTPASKADGSPAWVLPVIHDTATGVSVAESFAIAEYLEKTYPSTPSLFPHGTIVFQELFNGAVPASALEPLGRFFVPEVYRVVNPASKEFIRRTREAAFGKALEDIAPTGDEAVAAWAKAEAGWGTIAAWYAKSGGPFLLGPTVSWADFYVVCWLITARSALGEEDQRWKNIASWHGGRFVQLLDDLKEYQAVL
ncbi:hypothetical protein HYPSUDRAFT_33009 [Hypholoma sublateritium FD-334 SS-4]|uniref:GST N-terminal domain-containing protein n=1 Tax=Hypholoma sublateritium (strain FD-334 SS-4) TaxID=945553 RepID=A0A0D2PMJ3_HYPSF|nr:hypothetical protein HYPSUDRAFT_33009 [Hypholoma sublateritium FD-334 SS-4]